MAGILDMELGQVSYDEASNHWRIKQFRVTIK
jgi:hypothetical protein